MESRRKILIADHYEFDYQDLRKALIAEGYEVRIAKSSSDIFPYIEAFKPDLLMIEARLPELHLQEVIHKIRQQHPDRTLPVVLTSTPRTIDERIALLELDVDEFFYKPFEVDEVLARLEILIKEAQYARSESPVSVPGFSGSLSEMSLVDLLQTLEVGKKTAVVTLQKGGQEGKVYVTNGEVVDAELQKLEPKKALLRLFTWNEGQFTVGMKKHDRKKQIFVDTSDLISEGVTRLYRWEQLSKGLPSLQSVVLRAPDKDIQQLTADEEKVLHLINGQKRFIDVIEESEFDDLKALRLLKTLFEKGLVLEAPMQNSAITEDYLEKFKTFPDNGHTRAEVLEGIFSTLFRKPQTFNPYQNERRRIERRKGERRRMDRRRSNLTARPRIFLNRSELILVREKLMAGIKQQKQSD